MLNFKRRKTHVYYCYMGNDRTLREVLLSEDDFNEDRPIKKVDLIRYRAMLPVLNALVFFYTDAINLLAKTLGYDFLEIMDSLEKEGTYVVYCRTGRRSVRTCTLMKNAGFKNIYNLDGGLVALREFDPSLI